MFPQHTIQNRDIKHLKDIFVRVLRHFKDARARFWTLDCLGCQNLILYYYFVSKLV